MTADPFIGKIIDGTYRITGKLGEGGMGMVYKAWDENLRKNWAIKMLRAELSADEALVERFKNESIMQASLDHRNIVNVVVSKLTDAGLIIVMEFVEGKTLAKLIEEKGVHTPLSLQEVRWIFEQLLNAFEYAHKTGMVHRDIKPQNIIVKTNADVKITDFGLAKIQGDSRVGGKSSFVRAGTLEYMSPEQVIGPLSRVDYRGDIYSLGVTLFECAVGRLPFPDPKNGEDVQDRILDGNLLRLRQSKPDLPEQLEIVIQKSTHKDKGQRFQSAGEMWGELAKVSEAAQSPPNSAAGPTEFVLFKDAEGKKDSDGKSLPWRKAMLALISVSLVVIAAYLVKEYWPGSGSVPSDNLISVTSSPNEASVYFNERLIGVTPLENYQIQSGVAKLRIAKPGFQSVDTNIFVREGDKPQMRVVLPPAAPTTMSVRSEPGGAKVSQSGRIIGITPLDSYSMKAGSSTVRVEKEGYQARDMVLELQQGQDTSIFVQLVAQPKAARLVLNTEPAGGTVSFDGTAKQIGTFSLTAGKHTVQFRHPNYGTSREFSVELQSGESRELMCHFMLYVSVIAEPYGYIWVDGKNTDLPTPNARYGLSPGKHTVTVKRMGYTAEEGDVQLNVQPELTEQVRELVFTLVRN